ncbi:hypothetical protein D3C72_1639830 [compost metagenome]
MASVVIANSVVNAASVASARAVASVANVPSVVNNVAPSVVSARNAVIVPNVASGLNVANAPSAVSVRHAPRAKASRPRRPSPVSPRVAKPVRKAIAVSAIRNAASVSANGSVSVATPARPRKP